MKIEILSFWDITSQIEEAISKGGRLNLEAIYMENMGLTEELLYRLYDYYPYSLNVMKGCSIIGGISRNDNRIFTIKKENEKFFLEIKGVKSGNFFSRAGAIKKNDLIHISSEHNDIEDAIETAISESLDNPLKYSTY